MKARILLGLAALAVGSLRAQDAVLAQQSLTLDQAIRIALAHNRQLKVDSYDTGIGRANLLAAWGQFDPAIQFQRTFDKSVESSTNQSVLLGAPQVETSQANLYSLNLVGTTMWGLQYSIGGNASGSSTTIGGQTYPGGWDSFGGFTFTEPLLRGFGLGANLQGVRVARASKRIAEWTYRQTLMDTVANVIGAYSDVQLARDDLRIAQESKDLAASLVNENERRFKIGSMSRSDVIQAKAQEGLTEEPILFARRGLIDAENALRSQLGEEKFSPDGPGLRTEPMPNQEEEIAPAADLQKAYDLRPDYQSQRLNIQKFQANQAAALNGLLPQVNFVGSYGYNGLANTFQTSRQMVFDRENPGYTAGLVVSVPITFAQGRGQYRSAKLQRLQAEANLKLLEQTIALSVTNAAGQVETTRQRIATARQAYQIGQQALDDEQKKLRAGSSNTLFVLQLEQQMTALEGRVAQAEADHRRALALYDHEIGTTLDRNHVTLAPD